MVFTVISKYLFRKYIESAYDRETHSNINNYATSLVSTFFYNPL